MSLHARRGSKRPLALREGKLLGPGCAPDLKPRAAVGRVPRYECCADGGLLHAKGASACCKAAREAVRSSAPTRAHLVGGEVARRQPHDQRALARAGLAERADLDGLGLRGGRCHCDLPERASERTGTEALANQSVRVRRAEEHSAVGLRADGSGGLCTRAGSGRCTIIASSGCGGAGNNAPGATHPTLYAPYGGSHSMLSQAVPCCGALGAGRQWKKVNRHGVAADRPLTISTTLWLPCDAFS